MGVHAEVVVDFGFFCGMFLLSFFSVRSLWCTVHVIVHVCMSLMDSAPWVTVLTESCMGLRYIVPLL